MTDQLVSVVIPAFNAATTLDETLVSVRTQTHRALEIIVVDDGSSDDTAAIAQAHAAADERVRVMSQPNGGVARARNSGWQAASADLIAFIDADDLWAPEKISRQLSALAATGGAAGLVYSRSVLIDEHGRVCAPAYPQLWNGEVLDRLFHGNIVGNGSSAMVRRAALEAVGGFEQALHDAGAQGCEDMLFYCRVAERYEFAKVEHPDIGYRISPGNMSDQSPRMLRSWLMVRAELLGRHPRRRGDIDFGTTSYAITLFDRARRKGDTAELLQLTGILAKSAPIILLRMAKRRLIKQRGRPADATPERSHVLSLGERFTIGTLK